MTVYKESMVNKIEDDLAGRNDNWDTLETHLAESVADDVHGLSGKVIAESGSNENGSYVKFDDGTLECWNRFDFGSIAKEEVKEILWTYPVPAVSGQPIVVQATPGAIAASSATLLNAAVNRYPGATTCPIYLRNLSTVGDISSTVSVLVFAIGKWK